MDKRLWGIFIPLIIIFGVLGYSFIGRDRAGLSVVYLSLAILSALLLVVCCLTVKKKNKWFILLFSSVSVVNIGYTFLSISSGLETALWANRVSYLGSVFLPFAMMMIILEVTNTKFKKSLPIFLNVLSVVVFLVAASPGVLDIYYKDVSFSVVGGVSVLVKEYGVLHPLYLVYLLGYFSAMIGIIIISSRKKTIATTSRAVVIAIAVFVNIGVWLIEQLTSIDFEFLSVSYIISEMFLLGVHLILNENERLNQLLSTNENDVRETTEKSEKSENNDFKKPEAVSKVTSDDMECFHQGVERLTPTEKSIYELYLCGYSTKEIMTELNIKENTLKFHNKNIYGKLGVSSKKRLIEVYEAIKEEMEWDGEKFRFSIELVDRKIKNAKTDS